MRADQLIGIGRIIYGIGVFGLGMLCFVLGHFIVGRPPQWSSELTANAMVGYVTGIMLMLCSLAVLTNRFGGVASTLVATMILVLAMPSHLIHFMDDWVNAYKSIALFGGSLITASSFFQARTGLKVSARLLQILVLTGCLCLAAFFLAAGYAHFKFADFVRELIPSYIPFRLFWTYFCGVCLAAGGIGIVLPQTRRLASLMSAIMILGWFLLLHIPRFLVNTLDAGERLGLCESFTFVGIFAMLSAISTQKKPINSVEFDIQSAR
jgi:uncharacterized membrane protein